MTETERLRQLLDERGEPWRCYGHENHTWWGAWHAENRPTVNGLFMKVEGVVTPEQAIAATLGRGTCKDVWDVELTGRLRFQCSECGAVSLEITPRFCPGCGREVVE